MGAPRKTTTKSANEATTNTKDTKKNINTEEQLRQENVQLRSEIDEIKKMLVNLKSVQDKPAEPLNIGLAQKEELQEYEIRPNKYIKVISLVYGILVLSTEPMGNGKVFVFNKFGETKNIIYSDLAEILHCNQSFAESGKFYIADKNVVFNHGLMEFYKNILTKEMIENLFDYSQEQVVDLFKNATESQKETIVSIISDRLLHDQEVDLNKVNAISRIYGKDIIDMADEAKSLLVVS